MDSDIEDITARVRATVALIEKRYGCKTSRCKSKKAGKYCGPGCKCFRYRSVNLLVSASPDTMNIETECDSASHGSDDLEQQVDEIMNIFGDCVWANDHSGLEGDSDISNDDSMNAEPDS